LTDRDFERLAIGPTTLSGESVPAGGTKHMTPWAVEIKTSRLPRIMAALEVRLAEPDIDKDLKVHIYAQVLEHLDTADARWWIDNKRQPPWDYIDLYWGANLKRACVRRAHLRHFSWPARLRRQARDCPGPDAVKGEGSSTGSSSAAPTNPQSSPVVAGDGPADAFAPAESVGYVVCDDVAIALDYHQWCRDRERPCVTVAARGSSPADDRGARSPAEYVAVALSMASCPWNLRFEAQVEAMAACRACVPPGDGFGRFDIEPEWVFATVPRDAAEPLAARLYAIATHYDGPAWWFDPHRNDDETTLRAKAEGVVHAEGGRSREPIGAWVNPPRKLLLPPPRTEPDDTYEYDRIFFHYFRRSCTFCMTAVDLAKAIRTARLPGLRALAMARATDPETPRGDRALYPEALDAIIRDRRAAFWIDVHDASGARIVEAAVAGLRQRLGA
jgi:hypothetical protein